MSAMLRFVIVAVLSICLPGAMAGEALEELSALVKRGYQSARGEEVGAVPGSPLLTQSLGEADLQDLTRRIQEPSVDGVPMIQNLVDRAVPGSRVSIEVLERHLGSQVLSALIVDRIDEIPLVQLRIGDATLPIHRARILCRPYVESARERGLAIDWRAKVGYLDSQEVVDAERQAETGRAATIDAAQLLSGLAEGEFSLIDALFVNAAIIGKRRWDGPDEGMSPGQRVICARGLTVWAFEKLRRDPAIRRLAYGRAPSPREAEEYVQALARLWATAAGMDPLATAAEFLAVASQGPDIAPEHVRIAARFPAIVRRSGLASEWGLVGDTEAKSIFLMLPTLDREQMRGFADAAWVASIDMDATELANTWIKEGRIADGANLLSNITDRFPTAFISVRALAMALVKLDEIEDARRVIAIALSVDPAPTIRAELLSAQSAVERSAGDQDRADDLVRQAFAIDPASEPTRAAMADVYLRHGAPAQAAALARGLLESRYPEMRALARIILDRAQDAPVDVTPLP